MTNAHELIERLEAGETGRAIDADVFRHFGYTVKVMEGFGGDKFLAYPPDGPQRCEPARLSVSTSLDAAIALVERMRPGQCVLMAITPAKTVCDVHSKPLGDPVGKWPGHATAPTPAAALIAALLRAGDP